MEGKLTHPAGGEPFAALLRRHRVAAALSQEALAARAGLSTRAVSDLERGVKQRPYLETVRLLADALGLAPEDRVALLAAARPPTAAPREQEPPPEPGPSRLPLPPNPLVGRERELAAVVGLLSDPEVRLVTLTGPGGVGKTRLALAVAGELVGTMADGAVFVDLAPVGHPGLVASTVAGALGVREKGGRSLAQALVTFLQKRELLLVLDNVEHVLPAAPLVAELLAACPGLTALATSRAPLRLRGEREVAVPPLALPDAGPVPLPERLTEYGAVRLFVERARDVTPDFAVTQETAPAVVEICRRLDGLPLAIELAAARTRLLPPSALLDRLEKRLPLLTGGARDLPARQRTLRDAIAWSHELLSTGQQVLFARLGVFVGGCTLEAATTVGAGDKCTDVFDGLSSLLDNSLVHRADARDDERRFRMLETVREFALERLGASGQEAATRDAHARYFHALARRAAPELHGPRMRRWDDAFEAEHPNLRAALDRFAETGRATEELELAISIGPFWYRRALQREGADRLEDGVRRGSRADPALRAEALAWVGHLCGSTGERTRMLAAGEAACALAEEAGDDVALANALYVRSLAEGWFGGDRERGIALAERAVTRLEASGQEAWFGGLVLSDLGAMLILAGRRDRGIARVEEAVAFHRERGQLWGAAISLAELGLAAQQVGDAPRAAERYGESLRLMWEVDDRTNVYHAITGLAGLAADLGRWETTARLLGAVAGIEERVGAAVHPPFRPIRDWALERARSKLGEADFAAALAAGRALPMSQAVAEALELSAEVGDDEGL